MFFSNYIGTYFKQTKYNFKEDERALLAKTMNWNEFLKGQFYNIYQNLKFKYTISKTISYRYISM